MHLDKLTTRFEYSVYIAIHCLCVRACVSVSERVRTLELVDLNHCPAIDRISSVPAVEDTSDALAAVGGPFVTPVALLVGADGPPCPFVTVVALLVVGGGLPFPF